MAKKKPEEDLDLGVEQEKGSKKKLIIIAAIALLLLVGGGLAAGWFLLGDDGRGHTGQLAPEMRPADRPAP